MKYRRCRTGIVIGLLLLIVACQAQTSTPGVTTAVAANPGPAEQTARPATVVQAQSATPAVPPTPMETAPPPATPAPKASRMGGAEPWPAGGGLRARLEIPATLRLGEPLKIQFFLVNDAGEDLYVLNWFTPLEGLGGDIFRVRRDGETVPYEGPLAERAEPTPEAYTFIAAGAIAWAEVDLTRAYDFSDPGNYTIEFNSPDLSHIARSEAEMASTYDELGPIQIPANEVSLTIEDDPRSSIDIEAAREVLARFFSLLSQGQYVDAVALYGGGYESLRDWNPTVDLEDRAALFERGCTANGLRCLPARTIMAMGAGAADTYTFAVQFEEPDGSPFLLKPGLDWAEDTFPQSLFEFTVVRTGDALAVQDLPVYVP